MSDDMVWWDGPIAFEGQPTADGRLIIHGALGWDLPIAIYGVGGKEWDRVLVGLVESVDRDHTGAIYARCRVDSSLPVGSVGITVSDVDHHEVDGDLFVITSGKIRSVSAYLDPDIQPAWPAARPSRA